VLKFYEIVSPNTTVGKTARLLGVRGVSHAAVVDDNGVLVSVVSVRDLARYLLESFEEAGVVERLDLHAVLETPVIEASSKPPLTVRERKARECAEIMFSKHIGFLPVVDENGALKEACTELDYAAELLDSKEPARCYATHEIIMGDPGEPLVEALGFMYEGRVRRLPLRRGGDYYMATMNNLLLFLSRNPHNQSLLREVSEISTPSPRLSYEEATIGEAAELILASTERALLLLDSESLARAILTERDLLAAYLGERRREC